MAVSREGSDPMQYRLRTLLILLAVGPIALAFSWWWLTQSTWFSAGGNAEFALYVAGVLLVFGAIAAER
jgi:hypothetical protein